MKRFDDTMPAKRKEIEPLLQEGKMSTYYPSKPVAINIRNQREKEEIDDENFEEEILMTERKRKRKVSQLGWDATLIILEYLQIHALIQSMSLRWVWPADWLTITYPIFVFNLDFWEFMKMYKSGVYKSIQGYYTESVTVPMDFSYMTIAWFVLIVVLTLLFFFIYGLLRFIEHPQFLSHFARLRKAYFFIIQVLTLPFGVFLAHTFHCNDSKQVDVMNNLTCFEGLHWLYLTFAITVAIVIFIVFPVYVIYSTRQEALGSCSKHHESFLLLKEMEYKVGLNKFWLISDVHLFSSYRYWGMYYRAISQWVKLILVIIMAAGFQNYYNQAVAVTVFLFVFFVFFLILRPFRLLIFNVMIIFSFVCLGALSLIGAMATTYNSYTLASPWLLPQYSKWILTTIDVIWFFICLMFVLYIVFSQCLYHYQCIKFPIWPTFSNSKDDQLSDETKKFIKTFLRARFVLEKTQKFPAMFAPVHELSHQIQILNAYCREAEFLGDALHGTMWDLLDEMIEVHTELAPRSLFAESVKQSIRETAAEFMDMMPVFAQRLAQRDYDLILVSPVKKRMLLKMFCLGAFMHGRSEKIAKAKLLTQPALETIWQEQPLVKELEEEDGYYEDLYPDPLDLSDDSSLDLSIESSESENEGEITFTQMLDQLPDISTIDAPQGSSLTGSRQSLTPQPVFRPPSGGSNNRPVSASSRTSTSLGRDNQGFFMSEPGQDDGRVSLPGSIEYGEDNPAFDMKNEDTSMKTNIIEAADEVIDMDVKVQGQEVKGQGRDEKSNGDDKQKQHNKRKKSKADLKESQA